MFRRLNTRPRLRPRRLREDESGTLHHMSTENDAVDLASDRRRESFQNDPAFLALHRSRSFPTNFPVGEPSEKAIPEEPSDTHKERSTSVVEAKITSNSSVETPDTNDANVDKSTTRRRRDRLMPWTVKGESHETDDDKSFAPDSKTRSQAIPVAWQLKMIFGAWANVLLCFVPAGFAVYYTHESAATIFVVNFFAIIPLGMLLQFSLEELSLYIGDVLGGILNTSSRLVCMILSAH